MADLEGGSDIDDLDNLLDDLGMGKPAPDYNKRVKKVPLSGNSNVGEP